MERVRVEDSVSVVIPAYNHGRYVTAAVDSALAQTLQPTEVIVVDDGSTDDTAARLSRYGKRIRYILQENRGLSAARNTGIRHATGEWIALLDADDVWHQQKLEIQLAAVSGMEDVALVGSPNATSADNVPLPHPEVHQLTLRDFVLSSMMGTTSALIRRRSLETIGLFDESLTSVEDRDMWMRLAARYKCILVNSPCWWYRQHPTQMNRNANRMFVNYGRVLNNFFVTHPQHRKLYRLAMAYFYGDSAWSYFKDGERSKALYYLAKSAYYRPLGLGDKRRPRLIRLKLAVRVMLGRLP